MDYQFKSDLSFILFELIQILKTILAFVFRVVTKALNIGLICAWVNGVILIQGAWWTAFTIVFFRYAWYLTFKELTHFIITHNCSVIGAG